MRENRIDKWTVVKSLWLLSWTAVLVAPAGAAEVKPRIEVLDNGLRLLLVERHDQPVFAGCVAYDVGAVNDPRGQSGIAHVSLRLMASIILKANNISFSL